MPHYTSLSLSLYVHSCTITNVQLIQVNIRSGKYSLPPSFLLLLRLSFIWQFALFLVEKTWLSRGDPLHFHWAPIQLQHSPIPTKYYRQNIRCFLSVIEQKTTRDSRGYRRFCQKHRICSQFPQCTKGGRVAHQTEGWPCSRSREWTLKQWKAKKNYPEM